MEKYQKIFWAALLLGIALSPNILFFTVNLKTLSAYFSVRILIRIIFVFMLFSAPLFIQKVNLKIYFFSIFPLVLLAPFSMLTVNQYDILPSKWILLAVFQTNEREAFEFMGGFTWLLYFLPLSLCVYFWIIIKKIPKNIQLPSMVKKAYALILLSTTIVLFFWMYTVYGVTGLLGKFYEKVLVLSYPFGVINNSVDAYLELKTYEGRGKNTFEFQTFQKDSTNKRRISVVILGESSRYENWGLNGYHRDTSPNLSLNNNIVSFSNMISTAPLTGLSLPLIFTRATADHAEVLDEEKSIVSAFNEVGYKTHWVSNQVAEYSTLPIINEANEYHNVRTKVSFDDALLAPLERILSRNDSNVFIVIHTLGNHYDYAERYPERFGKYRPQANENGSTSRVAVNRSLFINSYDNSILYADYFINEVIQMVNKYEALSSILFLSDHGEIIFDRGLDKIGHGIGTLLPELYRIPTFIWLSANYKTRYPEVVEQLDFNRNAKLSTDYFFDSVLNLNFIKYPEIDLTRSFVSDQLVEYPRRILIQNDEIADFDFVKWDH